MMGMSDTVYWISVICTGLGIGLPLCLISTYQVCGGFNRSPFFEFSDPQVIFCVLLFYVIGTLLSLLLVTVVCYTGEIFYYEFVCLLSIEA